MSLWTAMSVDPDVMTAADVAAVADEIHVTLTTDVPADFFQPGQTYRGSTGTFRCAEFGTSSGGSLVAIGYLSIVLRGVPTWEFGALTNYNWARGGWMKVEA